VAVAVDAVLVVHPRLGLPMLVRRRQVAAGRLAVAGAGGVALVVVPRPRLCPNTAASRPY